MTARRAPALAAACLLMGQAATAVATHGRSEDPFFERLPVVLTISRLPQSVQDTPGAISVIDEEMIKASGYRDLARLLRLVPGMQIAQERANGQWVSYHGLGADYPNQMQVLVDGRSVYSPYFFGGADWGALGVNPEDVERIEIVRGSDSAAYGSNAALGVINIITRHTATESGSSLVTTLGNQGITDLGVRTVRHFGPLGIRLSAHHVADAGSANLNDGRRIGNYNIRGDLRLNDNHALTIDAGISEGRRGTGYEGVLFNGSGEHDIHHRNSHLQLRWNHAPSPDEEWSLSWYHNVESARESWIADSHRNLDGSLGSMPAVRDAILALPRLISVVDQNRDSRRNNIAFEHRLYAFDNLRTVWGFEWRQDELRARTLFNDNDYHVLQEQRLFGNAEWRMAPHWLWNLGSMLEHIEGDAFRLAPRLFLNWQPDHATTLRTGYSRAWRQPSLFEREADTRIEYPQIGLLQLRQLANPDLQPERIDTVEIGLVHRLPQLKGSLDLRVFHERIRDYIVRESLPPMLTAADNRLPDPNLFQRILGGTRWNNSAGLVRLNGIEYSLKLKPWRDGQLIFNHTLIKARAAQARVADTVAPYTASLTWLQSIGAWQSMISVTRTGPTEVATGTADDRHFRVKPYNTLDISLGRRLQVGRHAFDVRLSGINLLGSHQEMVHKPVELLPQYSGDKAANPLEPQLYVSIGTAF